MARKVFFSFHYQNDIWRVNQIRNYPNIVDNSNAGYIDSSLWEKVKKESPIAIKRMINKGIEGTSVTAILIGEETYSREYIVYEIEQSLKAGNGLIGIHIHNLKCKDSQKCSKGTVPFLLKKLGVPCYNWNHKRFHYWAEKAYKDRAIYIQRYNNLGFWDKLEIGLNNFCHISNH